MERMTDLFPGLTDIQQTQFEAMDALYRLWNARINVISRKDMDNLMTHHVLHSLAIAKVIDFPKGSTILDVGTGGGFPGIPLAVLFPECRFTLCDSIGKKIKVAQAVADLLGGKGNIAILTGPSGDSGGLQRLEGYENILKNYPDMVQVVEPADCQWDTAAAQGTVESWLSAYDLNAIICENDGMAVGAGNAAGADSGIIITGVDGTPDGFEAIKDGRITGTVSQDGGAMAANGIEAACKLIDGETLESNTIITTNIWIDKENVADYE